MIHDFHSRLTPSNALKCFTCACCAGCIRGVKRTDVPLTDIDFDLLRQPALSETDVDCSTPPVPFMEGPLKGILIDPTGALHNGEGSTCLALCPPCKSALARNKFPRFSLANLNVIGAVPPELKPLPTVSGSAASRP